VLAAASLGRSARLARARRALLILAIPEKYPHGLDEPRFYRLFPIHWPVVFNFCGYTAAIKQLSWERPHNETVRYAGEEPVIAVIICHSGRAELSDAQFVQRGTRRSTGHAL
jgi:hypothetical protein